MNVCIDVGNTTISVGLFEGNKAIEKLSFTTDLVKTEDEYASLILQQITAKKIDIKKISKIIYSSVVPGINRPLKEAFSMVFKKEIMTIGPGFKTGLSIKVDNPSEIGNDLIADLVGAKEKYGYPCLIADLGTASKILLIDKNGTFSSCVILPGISLSAASLSRKAALLPDVALEAPKTILARNTVTAMNAGIVYGHADMILGLVKRYEKELGYPCKHILTGGGAYYVKSILADDFIYDSWLNLEGLNSLIERNEAKHEK